MLSNEAREMMIKAYEKTGNAKEVAECYGVDVSDFKIRKTTDIALSASI